MDGVVYALDEFPELQKSYKHNIELVVDRLALTAEMRSRLSQSVEQALDLGQGVIEVLDNFFQSKYRRKSELKHITLMIASQYLICYS